MLTVDTPAESYDLVTLEAARAELGTSTATDETVGSWITQASKAVCDYCRRVFIAETVTEIFRLQCRSACLFLTRYPVTEVSGITESGTALAMTDYEANAESGIVIRLSSDDPVMWTPSKIVVSYSAGYAQDEVPEPIQRATLRLIRAYSDAGSRDPMVRSEQIASGLYNATYLVDAVPPEIATLLDPYVRPMFG